LSNATWGSPIRPHAGGDEVFVAKLNGSGTLQWHTFLGGLSWDSGYDIAVDTSGNVYLAGGSVGTWGSPIRPHAGGWDAFVAKLNGSGALQWHTFLGGPYLDEGIGIALDTSGNVYLAGGSVGTWGSPLRPHSYGKDAFVAKLNGSGTLQWHTFLGGAGDDWGNGIAVDTSWNVYVAGRSNATWGSPIRTYTGSWDAFVARISDWPIGVAVYPPINFSVQRLENNLIFFKEYINRLTWIANPMNTQNIVAYRIYIKASSDPSSAFDLLVELPANTMSYDDRGLQKESSYTYRITSIDEDGRESNPNEIGN